MRQDRAPKGGVCKYGKWFPGGRFTPFYVPRILMPQIEGQFYDDFITFAGDKVRHCKLNPSDLIPHQRVEINHAVNLSQEQIEKPIIVSHDGFIVDGHHRWYWHYHRPSDFLNALQLQMNFAEAIAFAFSFPQTYCYRDQNGNER